MNFSTIVFNSETFLFFSSCSKGEAKVKSVLIFPSSVWIDKSKDEKLDGRGNFKGCTRSMILEHVCTVKINYPGKSWNRRQEQRCFARERGGWNSMAKC